MKSDKFIACCFVEIPNDDVFCNYEFKDSAGIVHVVVGKRGDWLYITDGDRIFTKNQLLRIKAENDYLHTKHERIMNYNSGFLLMNDAVNKARSLPGAEF